MGKKRYFQRTKNGLRLVEFIMDKANWMKVNKIRSIHSQFFSQKTSSKVSLDFFRLDLPGLLKKIKGYKFLKEFRPTFSSGKEEKRFHQI